MSNGRWTVKYAVDSKHWIVGCSDFNNFIRLTLGWLPNLILRMFIKRRFSFFKLFNGHLDSKFPKFGPKFFSLQKKIIDEKDIKNLVLQF